MAKKSKKHTKVNISEDLKKRLQKDKARNYEQQEKKKSDKEDYDEIFIGEDENFKFSRKEFNEVCSLVGKELGIPKKRVKELVHDVRVTFTDYPIYDSQKKAIYLDIETASNKSQIVQAVAHELGEALAPVRGQMSPGDIDSYYGDYYGRLAVIAGKKATKGKKYTYTKAPEDRMLDYLYEKSKIVKKIQDEMKETVEKAKDAKNYNELERAEAKLDGLLQKVNETGPFSRFSRPFSARSWLGHAKYYEIADMVAQEIGVKKAYSLSPTELRTLIKDNLKLRKKSEEIEKKIQEIRPVALSTESLYEDSKSQLQRMERNFRENEKIEKRKERVRRFKRVFGKRPFLKDENAVMGLTPVKIGDLKTKKLKKGKSNKLSIRTPQSPEFPVKGANMAEDERKLREIHRLQHKLERALEQGNNREATKAANQIRRLEREVEKREQRPVEKVEETRVLGVPRVPRKRVPEGEAYKRTGSWFKRMDRQNQPPKESALKKFGPSRFFDRNYKDEEKKRFLRDVRKNINKPSEEETYKTYGDFQGRLEKEGLIKSEGGKGEEKKVKKEEEKGEVSPKTKGNLKCPKCGSKNVEYEGEGWYHCKDCDHAGQTGFVSGDSIRVLEHNLVRVIIGIIAAFLIPFILGPIFGAIGMVLVGVGVAFLILQTLFEDSSTGGYIKGTFRTMGFIFITIGTWISFGQAPLLKLIPLLVASFAMVTYPISEELDTEMSQMLAMMRLIMGAFLVIIFGAIFSPEIAKANLLLAITIVLFSIGFFIVIPEFKLKSKEDKPKIIVNIENKVSVANKSLGGFAGKMPGFSMFKIVKILIILIIIIVAIWVISSLVGTAISFAATIAQYSSTIGMVLLGIIGGVVLLLGGVKMGNVNGIILGVCGGLGLMLGSIALQGFMIAFVFFLSVFFFGSLAALPVQKARAIIGVPLLIMGLMVSTMAYPDVMGEAVFGIWWPTIDYNIDSTIGPLIQGFESPMSTLGQGYSCLVNPQECYSDYQPQTSTKESIRSVEVTNIDPIGISKIDERTDDFMVITTVENRGKEDARNVRLIPKQPTLAQGIEGESEIDVGGVQIRCPDGSVSGPHNPQCTVDKLITGEIRELVLNYSIDQSWLDPGNYVSTGLDIEYETEIMGQVDVMVMDNDYYLKLSKNNRLERKEQVTEDTGGPVRLGLALMRNQMPVRDNLEGVPVLLYLNNQGPGVVERVLEAEVDINDLEAGETCTPDESGDYNLDGLEDIMNPVEEDDKLKSGESASATCISIVPDIQVEQKTFAINGRVTYTYSHGRERKIPIEFISGTEGDGDGGGSGPSGDMGDCYPVDSEDEDRFESCENWCQNRGMVCNSHLDCSSVDDSPAEWECIYGQSASGNEGADCGDTPTQEPRVKNCRLINCGCMEEDEGNGEEEPPASGCTDSDGINYFNAGYVVSESGTQGDSCERDTGEVTEYYCNGDEVASIIYNCPLGCVVVDMGDYMSAECRDGVHEMGDPVTCSDSDGGLNYYTFGTTSPPATPDICIGDGVEEWYCDQETGMPAYTVHSCGQNGCSTGRCNPP